MGADDRPPDIERSRTTRRLGSESGAPSSLVNPIWDPTEMLRPLVTVVDDSAMIRTIVKSTLTREGIEALAFPGGLEFLAALRDGIVGPPRVLLLDIGMPRMSGYHVAKALRTNPAFHDVKLFMLTGHDGMLDRAKSALLGAGFIAKPFEKGDLVKIVRAALGMPAMDDVWT